MPTQSDDDKASSLVYASDVLVKALLQHLPNGATFVVDRDLRYRHVGGEALHSLGLPPDYFVGKTVFEALPPDLAAAYEPLYRQALAGKPFKDEHRVEEHYFQTHGVPLRNPEGAVDAVLAVSYDVTDRKQAEAALRESEEKYRHFVSATSDIVYRMSADWHEMQNLFGKEFIATTDEPRTGWVDGYIPETDRRLVWETIEKAIRTKSIFELEHRVIRLDGSIGWTFSRAIPVLDERGEIVEWLGAARDITARKRTEEALRESEEKYRAVFESLDEGVSLLEVLFDESGRAVDYRFIENNRAVERMTGVGDSIGKTVLELFPDIDKGLIEVAGEVARTGRPIRFQHTVPALGRWFDVHEARAGGQGSPLVVAVFADITERKRAEETQAFLLKLSDALRPLSDPVAVQETAMQILGKHLGVNRAFYGDMQDDGDTLIIGPGYAADVPPLEGYVKFSEFDSDLLNQYRQGQTVVINDINVDVTNSEAARAALEAIEVRSAVGVPLLKEGKVQGILSVHHSAPRKWAAEIALIEETAERTWAAVERAKAENSLRQSEAKYRTLFDTMSQGYVEAEIVRDADGRAIDYRQLRLNAQYERLTGIPLEQALGRTAREIVPDLEPSWIEAFDRIVRSGKPFRFEGL